MESGCKNQGGRLSAQGGYYGLLGVKVLAVSVVRVEAIAGGSIYINIPTISQLLNLAADPAVKNIIGSAQTPLVALVVSLDLIHLILQIKDSSKLLLKN